MDHRFTGPLTRSSKGRKEVYSKIYQVPTSTQTMLKHATKAGLTGHNFGRYGKVATQDLLKATACLQEIGFKPSKVSKLITAGEFKAMS